MKNPLTPPFIVLALIVAAQFLAAAAKPAAAKSPTVRPDVLAAAETELARLSTQAKTEAGPVHPAPSSEIAYLLLTGLASQGSTLNPTAENLSQLGITPSNNKRVQLFTVAADAWIAIGSVAIQDKSGYWTSKTATLYRRQAEKWVEAGSGSTAKDGVSLSD
jgi:hypothetical protein